MNKFQAACGFLMIATVSACSSSNSNGGGGTVGLPVADVAGSFILPLVADVADVAEGAPDDETVNLANQVLAGLLILQAPTEAETPTAAATFNGYIALELDNDDYIAGYLEIDADFGDGTGTSKASGFKQFTFDGATAPTVATTLGLTGAADELTGVVTISGSDITSTLDGTLTSTVTDLVADLDLDGDLYQIDEGLYQVGGDEYRLDEDHLVIAGGVTGTVNEEAIGTDSGFIALEILPAEMSSE